MLVKSLAASNFIASPCNSKWKSNKSKHFNSILHDESFDDVSVSLIYLFDLTIF